MSTANPWLSGAGFDAYRSAGWRYLGIAAVLAALAVEILVKAAGGGSAPTASPQSLSSYVNDPVPASLMATLKTASTVTLNFRGGPKLLSAAARVSTATGPIKGGPTMFYQGADFCPFCAAERWALVLTLMRFGTVGGLRYMTSNPGDVYPNTPTFTFVNITYKSPYMHLDAAEVANRTDTAALQTPSAANNAALSKYDTAKYVGASAAGTIPFVDIGNRYVWVGAPYVPSDLLKKQWRTIAQELVTLGKTGQGDSNIQAIARGANEFTAAVCSEDGGQPANVCKAAGVVAAQGGLPK
jgi:hypothetical protein